MIHTTHIGTTIIGYCDIPDARQLTRRQRETAAVRNILQHLGVDPLALTHDSHGAPRLPGKHLSITHSQKLAAVALDAIRPVGIDAEEPRAQLQKVKHRYLSDSELGFFDSMSQLLAAWTIKEAVYKITSPHAVDFRSSIAISQDFTKASADGRDFAIHTLDVGETHIALAVPACEKNSPSENR